MTDLCTHCGEHLAVPAIFCARCGARAFRPPEAHHEHPPAEKAPVTGAFSGLYFGIIALPLMLVVGILLFLTGWGIIFGLPVLVLAIFAPLARPLFGMGVGKDEHADGAAPPPR
jgi:cytochrome b561